MANIPAAGPSGLPEAGERAFAVNGDQRLLQALTTEHFTLQTARSATIMESNGRSALFLSTVSSAVVALAFIGQLADVGQPFFLFALAVLPTLFLLGLLTYLRLAQSASEDLLYSRAINRIRRYYLDLDPAAPSWFLLGRPRRHPWRDGQHGPGRLQLAPAVPYLDHGRGHDQHDRRGLCGRGCRWAGRRPGPGGRRRSGRGPGQPHPRRGPVAGPGPAVAHRRAERAVLLPVHPQPWVARPANGCLVPRRRRGRSRRGRPTERRGPLTWTTRPGCTHSNCHRDQPPRPRQQPGTQTRYARQ